MHIVAISAPIWMQDHIKDLVRFTDVKCKRTFKIALYSRTIHLLNTNKNTYFKKHNSQKSQKLLPFLYEF